MLALGDDCSLIASSEEDKTVDLVDEISELPKDQSQELFSGPIQCCIFIDVVNISHIFILCVAVNFC